MIGRVLILAGAVALGIGAAPARPHRYAPAPEAIPAELSDADSTAVAAQCGACHSLDYITTQPRDKGAQFWRDEVTKMVNVYKAPLAPADADAVAAVLARKFAAAGG